MFKQMVIHDEGGALELWSRALEEALGDKAAVVQMLNLERASKALQSKDDQWSLIVLHATARADAYAKGRRTCAAACEFVRELKRRVPKQPVIAIANAPCEPLAELLKQWPDTALLPAADMDCISQLRSLARQLAPWAVGQLARTLDVDLDFIPGLCNWRLVTRGRFPTHEIGSYAVDPSPIQDLRWNQRPDADGPFHAWMEHHSRKIGQFVFPTPASRKFWQRFVERRAEVGGMGQTRIRLSADDTLFRDVVLEALKDTDDGNDFWMLEAPITRQYRRGSGSKGLFAEESGERRAISALVVVADCAVERSGAKRASQPYQRPLEQAASEAKEILELLAAAGEGSVLHKKMLLLDYREDPVATLREALAERTWDLVHFIGHAFVDQNKQAQLVLAFQEEQPVLQAFANVTAQLRDTRFLFLSCCHGGSAEFLDLAAQQMLPTTLGYRWEVDDYQARVFAHDFYEALFDPGRRSFLSVDYAFVGARAAAYRNQANGAIWAAPLLLTQLANVDA